jgi:hypothetical protein
MSLRTSNIWYETAGPAEYCDADYNGGDENLMICKFTNMKPAVYTFYVYVSQNSGPTKYFS